MFVRHVFERGAEPSGLGQALDARRILYAFSNLGQLQHKLAILEVLDDIIHSHLGNIEVGSQRSLRWLSSMPLHGRATSRIVLRN